MKNAFRMGFVLWLSVVRMSLTAEDTLELHRIRGESPSGAVLDFGERDAFDATWVSCPSVVRVGEWYWMYYSAFFDRASGAGGIGLAKSKDGVTWRRANRGEPVLTPGRAGAQDAGQVMGPHVLRDNDRFHMWYTGMDDRPTNKRIQVYRIFHAVSDDGISWQRTRDGNAVLDVGPADSPDAVQAATPVVLRDLEGAGYVMWYAAWAESTGHTICVARSDDGIRWTRWNNGRPVTGLRPEAYGMSVCRIGERYVMMYQVLKATRGLYAAISSDGVNWTALRERDPVLEPVADQKAFDSYILGHPDVHYEDGRLRVWYTGFTYHPSTGLRPRIGLAAGKWNP
ncbi:MAG: hypothetical protein AB7F89_23070 [Pirellulaceae bacterium]